VEVIYGRNSVIEALKRGRACRTILLAEGVRPDATISTIEELADQAGARVDRVPRDRLNQITRGAGHQGVAAQVEDYRYVSLEDILCTSKGEAPLLLALDNLQDPQNLGTLLRTAEAVGVDGVIIPERRAAAVTPAVCNASSGAVEHLKVARVTNLARALTILKQRSIWVIGVEMAPYSVRLDQVDLTVPLAMVIGGEGEGMRRLVRDTCDLLVRLPMVGKIDSLNAAVAGSVVLYETLRQRTHCGTNHEEV
jgi:23S rRNA (guanosine2251-2'-O)-methyltransferase